MVKNKFRNSFIGKPVDFFKTNTKDYPVNMFKDNDRDGVMNAFDCSPNNPNKQGLIDAVVGAVRGIGKGRVKSGWREGMDKLGNPGSRAYKQRREVQRQKKDETFSQKNERQQQRIIKNRLRREGIKKVVSNTGYNTAKRIIRKIETSNPNYSKRVRKQYLQNRTNNPNLTREQRGRAQYHLSLANKARTGLVDKVRNRAIESVFPVVSVASYIQGKRETIPGMASVGRGRPRGTLDKRYVAYGGVFGYRAYLSQKRQQARAMLQQQQEMMRQQNMPQYEQVQKQMPQYQQSQQSQLPPELQGQGITPEYSQEQQYQQALEQYQSQQQVPQQVQYPQQEQPVKREIVPVFKSHGGSPYPPVDRRPLQTPQSTIPYGYVESVDAFTGRRYLKQLPKKEGWTR